MKKITRNISDSLMVLRSRLFTKSQYRVTKQPRLYITTNLRSKIEDVISFMDDLNAR